MLTKPGKKTRNRPGEQQGCQWLHASEPHNRLPPTYPELAGPVADHDQAAMIDPIKGTDANMGASTVFLDGHKTTQTQPTPCVDIPEARTATIYCHSCKSADTPHPVQSITLGTTPTEHQGGELDALRLLRNKEHFDFVATLTDID